MSPSDVVSMRDNEIVEMLVSLRPSDQAVAWLASVIADPVMAAGVSELSRRYGSKREGRVGLPRARSATTVHVDGARFKEFFWMRRIPLRQVGPMVGKCEGLGSVIAHKGRIGFWTADSIATELGMHVDSFIAAVGTSEELQRLSA